MSTNALIESMYHDLVTGKVYPLLTHQTPGYEVVLGRQADANRVNGYKKRYLAEIQAMHEEGQVDALSVFLQQIVLANDTTPDTYCEWVQVLYMQVGNKEPVPRGVSYATSGALCAGYGVLWFILLQIGVAFDFFTPSSQAMQAIAGGFAVGAIPLLALGVYARNAYAPIRSLDKKRLCVENYLWLSDDCNTEKEYVKASFESLRTVLSVGRTHEQGGESSSRISKHGQKLMRPATQDALRAQDHAPRSQHKVSNKQDPAHRSGSGAVESKKQSGRKPK